MPEKKQTLTSKRVSEAEQVARQAFAECLAAMRRRSHAPLVVRAGWSPELNISWHPHHNTSHGSAIRVTLVLGHHANAPENTVTLFAEYSRVANEPAIGSVLTNDWRHKVRILTCHEVAHSAQYAPLSKDSQWAKEFKKPHGMGWRRIYAYLRKELGVNEAIRSAGGLITQKEIEKAIQYWSASLEALQAAKDPNARHHLTWARSQRARLAPRTLRSTHETLCRGDVLFNLDPPLASTPGLCWDCFTWAVKIGGVIQKQFSIEKQPEK